MASISVSIASTVGHPAAAGEMTATPSRRRTPWEWCVTTGWRHLVGAAVCVVAVDNYVNLVSDPGRPFIRWWLNTLFVAGTTAVLSVFLCALAAYAFSRLRFRGRRAGLATIVIAQMFPQFLGIVAIYLLLSTLGDAVPALGLNSLVGLIVVYLGGALGVNTFLMYGYFNTIPRELDEAAKIDGAGHARIFFTIILPLVGPILVVVGMLIYIATAGDFVIASVVLSDTQIQTAPVGLYGMISLFRNDNWGAFCAGAVLTALPVMILFLFTQKYIVTGLFAGSGK